MTPVLRAPLLWLALLLVLAQPLLAQLPPDAEWRTLDTPHFRVHYTAALEPIARRAGNRAEVAYAALAESLIQPPQGRVDLVIADNVDFANGYATPFPSNRIVIYAHPPVDTPALSFYDDWLELVITHELTHVFHLDYARGIWRPLRSVFGRSPLLFPQLWSPGWLVEGLATHVESRLTRAGRVRATMHDMALRTAILDDAFFGIDRASGVSVTWPAGNTRYVYGSLFVDHLARRYGTESVSEFIEAVGGAPLPGRMNAAARRAFGVSFDRAWEAWEAELRARYTAQADSLRALGVTEPEVLTQAGRYAFFPRWSPDGERIAYAASTGRKETAVRLFRPYGEEATLARRNSLGPSAWAPDGKALLLAQLDYVDPYRVFADLYRVERDGSETRLTEGARLAEPDVAPDGRRVVAVESSGGTNALVILDLATGAVRPLVLPSLDTHWELPRWSPDGTRIAVGRWRTGGFLDVVVLDSAGRMVRELTRDRAVESAPAWSPDGRHVVFSSDRSGIANLYAYDLQRDRLWQVTSVLSGAFQPDVSPDGRWVAFSLYAADGYHIARIPWDPASWRGAPPVRAAVAAPAPPPERYAAAAEGPSRPYQAWRSLAPTSWTPLLASDLALGTAVGAGVFGTDVVGRHLYSAYTQMYVDGGRTDAALAYRYRGWGVPVLDASAQQEWSATRRGVESAGGVIAADLFRRERTLAATLTVPWSRIRESRWASVGADVRARVYQTGSADPADTLAPALADFPLDVGAIVSAGRSSVRGYEYSISPEDGWFLSATAQGRRYTRAFPGDDHPTGYLRLSGRSRAFQGFRVAGFARHVLAASVSAGADVGSRSPLFDVGGAGNGAGALFGVPDLDLGRTLGYPVRGYPEGAQVGDRAVSASAEYRFPLALVEGRLPVLPISIDRVWGDVFADAGGAWCGSRCEGRPFAPASLDPLASVGTELGLDFSAVSLRGGVAVPLRDAASSAGEPERPKAQLYVRLGRSF